MALLVFSTLGNQFIGLSLLLAEFVTIELCIVHLSEGIDQLLEEVTNLDEALK